MTFSSPVFNPFSILNNPSMNFFPDVDKVRSAIGSKKRKTETGQEDEDVTVHPDSKQRQQRARDAWGASLLGKYQYDRAKKQLSDLRQAQERLEEDMKYLALYSRTWNQMRGNMLIYEIDDGPNKGRYLITDIDVEEAESDVSGYITKKTGLHKYGGGFFDSTNMGSFDTWYNSLTEVTLCWFCSLFKLSPFAAPPSQKNSEDIDAAPPKRGFFANIGEFSSDANYPASKYLMDTQTELTAEEIKSTIESIPKPNGCSCVAQMQTSIGSHLCQKMIEMADDHHNMKPDDDIKIMMTYEEANETFGSTFFNIIRDAVYGNEAFFKKMRFVLRRCTAVGKIIDFHVDKAKYTARIILNEEFQGGQLCYLSSNKITLVNNKVGFLTVHNNAVVHGTTKMESGVRYTAHLIED